MWPFKKHPDIHLLDDGDERWSVLQGSTADGPILVRLNESAARWAKHPALPIRVGFAMPLNNPNPGGLPDGAENLVLNEVEDRILPLLKAAGPAIQVLAISTGTFKEFVYYIGNGDAVAGIHAQLQADVTSHEVQCVAMHDPAWEMYASYQP